ncbi:MAG TPA: VOC family protein [Thermoanaerobaculia bacterium]|jgi:predicted enzyme related to lactoylglutathione lyase|nr:VOC family protein [Thermoanaerobaculia bacterium]
MEKVNGIGGIFFKSDDAPALRDWYRDHLGIAVDDYGGTSFEWREKENPDVVGMTVWSAFPATTKYFEPTRAPFMINYRVSDLDAMLAQLRNAGAVVDEKIEDTDYGKFGWATDPEGNRFELWQPK